VDYATGETGVGTPQGGISVGAGWYSSVENFYNARVLSISMSLGTVNIGHIGWMPVGAPYSRTVTPPIIPGIWLLVDSQANAEVFDRALGTTLR
jgi:hypothetical protein